MKFKESEVSFFWQIIGPLFVVCTFSLSQNNPLLLFTSIFGLFISAKYRFSGFLASLSVLISVAIMGELYGTSQQAWSLGIECSYALAFYITAMSSDRHNKLITSLFSQLKLRDSSLQILEEEFTKTQNEMTKQQILSQGKIDSLQKQLDEITAEQSSLATLNEVLRKTTAKHIESNESLKLELYEKETRLAQEISEKEMLASLQGGSLDSEELEAQLRALSQENEQMKNKCEALAQQLLDEKQKYQNVCEEKARLEMEKEKITSLKSEGEELKNDQLEALYQENGQMKSKCEAIFQQLSNEQKKYQNVCEEKERLEQALSQENEQMQSKYEALRLQFSNEEQRYRSLREEKDRLETELLAKIKAAEKEGSNTESHVLEQEIKHLTQVAILYKQLKVQFEEKNQILHQTRSELFSKDTELQTLQIAHKELSASVPQELVNELMKLEKELSYLQTENFELQELVTALSGSSPPEPKKKVRMNPDQFNLF